MPKTLEDYQRHTYWAAIIIVALFVFSSIDPPLGVTFALLYALIGSLWYRKLPTARGNLARFFIIALVALNQVLGFLVALLLVSIALHTASNRKHLRSAYVRYLERESKSKENEK